MAKSNPFLGFGVDALKALLDALNVQYLAGSSEETLAGMVQEVQKIVSKEDFANAIAQANGYNAGNGVGNKPAATNAGAVTQPKSTGTHQAGQRSINPGTSILWTVVNGVGSVSSDTWDPPSPLEYGRTLV